jgi:hypothetical protein
MTCGPMAWLPSCCEFNKRVGSRRDQASATNTFIKFSIELEKKKLSIIHRIIGKLQKPSISKLPTKRKLHVRVKF